MNKEKYYCVKLNGYNYNINYYGMKGQNSFLENILIKEYNNLDNDDIEYDFLSLDNKVTIKDDKYLIEGVFPVIGVEKDNKLYDIITLEEIPKVKDGTSKFGYINKEEFSSYYANLLLSLLDSESIKRYKEGFNKLKNINLKNIENYNVSINNEEYYAVKVGDKLYEKFTKQPLYEGKENVVNYGISYDDIVKSDGINFIDEDYIYKVNSNGYNSHKNYNIFVTCNTNKKIKTRKKDI